MSLRPARFVDVPRLVELLVGSHRESRYVDTANVDVAHARKLLAQMVQRHGGTHDGGTCVFVVEREGVIQAFVVGALERVYFVGDRLTANDVFLVASAEAPPTAPRRLLAAYLGWATPNPNVVEIHLSWTDALASGERMRAVYERMGFRRCGEIWTRANCAGEERQAA